MFILSKQEDGHTVKIQGVTENDINMRDKERIDAKETE